MSTSPASHQPPGDTFPFDEDADQRAVYPPWGKFVIWPVVIAALALVGMIAGGVPPWRGAVIAVTSAVAMWALARSVNVFIPVWPMDVPWESTRMPSPWEVSGLTAVRHAPETFTNYLQPRLWDLTCELLARRGIAPDSDAAIALLGQREHALLSGADTTPSRIAANVSPMCLAIARAAVVAEENNPAPLTNPMLAGLAGQVSRAER